MQPSVNRRDETLRFAHIDAIRAVAVMLVVFSHADLENLVPGGAGVTMFFAISGFIITHILLREREKTGTFGVASFYVKRFLKLAPPLAVALIIPTLIYSLFEKISIVAFISQILFSYNWIRIYSDPAVLPGSGVVWSLAIEEQFYIIFSVIWLFAVRSKAYLRIITIISLAAVVLSLSLRFGIVFGSSLYQDRIYFGTDTRLDSIAIGILFSVFAFQLRQGALGEVWVRLAKSPSLLVVSLAMFIVATLIPGEEYRYTLRFTLQSIATSLVVLVGITRPPGMLFESFLKLCNSKMVQTLGLASYSIYLIHYPTYYLLDYIISELPFWATLVIKVSTGTILGIALWRFVEVPVEAYKRKRFI